MNIVSGFLYYGILIPVSRLPYRVLYFISDGLYVLLYRVLSYRKSVVLRNITNSFPDKSPQEHLEITDKFYSHLCDLIVESIKVFSISDDEVQRRMRVVNPEFINRFYAEGRSVILAGGHYNNWELFAVAIDRAIKHQAVALYKPFSNAYFDNKMCESRGKYGLKMVSTKKAKEEFAKSNDLRAIIFGIDQSPNNHRNAYWSTFLHQDTGMMFGVEKYARECNLPVIYARINKVRRGYYTFEFVEAIEHPLTTSYGEITLKTNRWLEQDIIRQPEFWLWSHKRWKHKRPPLEEMVHAPAACDN